MILTYKYRLYPTNHQNSALDFILWQGRIVYNSALEQRIAVYRETGNSVSYPEQCTFFRDLRNANKATLGKLNAASVQQLLRRLDKAFGAFFRRVKAGEKAGFPRFKSRARFNSIEYRHGDGCKLQVNGNGRALLYVQNVGRIKVKYHRPIPDGAVIKHVVIKRRLRKWYVCLMLELPSHPVTQQERPAIGIDIGLRSLLALSDGTTVENPHWLRNSLAKLRAAQRRMSRRKKNSNRRRKAAAHVARIHDLIANQRRDFWHKTTRKLVNSCGLIAIEGLKLEFMTSNHCMALSAYDTGLGLFRQMLAYKAESAGTRVVVVNPAYTSQVCSACGTVVKKGLAVRVHACHACGYTEDRDVNAAKNILATAYDPAWTGRSGLNVADCGERALRSSLI